MMQYVDEQAREKGLTAVDWVRFAIAFTYWEQDFLGHVAEEERKEGIYVPIDYAPAFEDMCLELEDPNSQTNLQRKHREAVIQERRRPGYLKSQTKE
jgi:hypothetical protein